MNIFDMFTSKPAETTPVAQAPAQAANATANATAAAPAQQQAPANQGNIPATSTVQTESNNPAAPVTPEAGVDNPESPLAGFKDLWDTDPNNKSDPSEAPAPLNVADVQKAVAKQDFSNILTPENLEAITAGGPEAAKAFAESMSAVAQQTMTQSIMVNNKLTEQAIAKAVAANEASLPTRLRNQSASEHLKTSNPLFNDPAIKPVVEATHQQLLLKYPNETNAQITQRVEAFMTAMSEQFAPKAAVNDNGIQETDWDAFMNKG